MVKSDNNMYTVSINPSMDAIAPIHCNLSLITHSPRFTRVIKYYPPFASQSPPKFWLRVDYNTSVKIMQRKNNG